MQKQFIAFIAVALFTLFNFVGQVYAAPNSSVEVTKTIKYDKHPNKPVCTKTLPNGCEKGVKCPGQTKNVLSFSLKDYLAQHGFTGDIDISIPGMACPTFDIDIGVPGNPCRCSGGKCYCWSDRRLKRNIQKVGQLKNGLNIYTFNYIWDSALTVGVMADEVRKVKPEAVININGFDLVDYSEIFK